jgi:hypothetical protein
MHSRKMPKNLEIHESFMKIRASFPTPNNSNLVSLMGTGIL